MKRKSFLLSTLLGLPAATLAERKTESVAGPFKVDKDQDRFGEDFMYRGNHFFLKVAAKDTAGALTVYDTIRVQKGGPTKHLHHAQDEWFFVSQGEFLFQVGDARYTAKAGDSVFGPRGVPHVFAQTSEGEGRLMITYQPAGTMEEYFREAKELKGATPEVMAALAEKHGMTVLGPALFP